ncbi:hypothetical protein HUO13_22050 [Saccharopolyspora erythraea]|nr:hypothetical protein HUO13_22050 [Saccharopolyspora erythraea]
MIRREAEMIRKTRAPGVSLRVLLTVGFTLVQAWAVVAAAGLARPGEGAVVALVLVLAAALIAVLDAWRDLGAYLRNAGRLPVDCGETGGRDGGG